MIVVEKTCHLVDDFGSQLRYFLGHADLILIIKGWLDMLERRDAIGRHHIPVLLSNLAGKPNQVGSNRCILSQYHQVPSFVGHNPVELEHVLEQLVE